MEAAGGLNKAPVHWDNITTFLDGELFYKDGKFMI